jgi:surface polysaccharide O-acyltransferase-like enzyme
MAFQVHVHRFRTLAIIGIVGAHTLHNFDWDNNPFYFSLFDALFNESSIWFFFIAGYLFQHLSGRFDLAEFWRKKLSFVVAPYLLISLPALVASLFLLPQEMPAGFYAKPVGEQAVLFLVTGKHLAPLWFVPTIMIIFLLAPLLVRADRARWPYWALILLLPLSSYLGRDGLQIHLGLSAYWGSLGKAAYLLAPFVAGMACSRYRHAVQAFVRQNFAAWSVMTVVLFGWCLFLLHVQGIHFFAWKLAAAPLILLLLQQPVAAALDRFHLVGHYSFGIFFLHGYLLAALKLTGPQWPAIDHALWPVAPYAVLVALVCLTCVIMVQISHRMLGERSRIVVGA